MHRVGGIKSRRRAGVRGGVRNIEERRGEEGLIVEHEQEESRS